MRSGRPSLSGFLYDLAMLPVELAFAQRLRRRLLKEVAGTVLEVGVGTGLNLARYEAAERVVAFDPDRRMLRRAVARRGASRVPTYLLRADGQALPFPDNAFDAVVASLVFCTIPDPDEAFEEVARVLKPGGRFVLVEHVLSAYPLLARIQHRLTPRWKRIAGGCHLDRPTFSSIRAHGFDVRHVTLFFWKHVLVIEAAAPASGA